MSFQKKAVPLQSVREKEDKMGFRYLYREYSRELIFGCILLFFVGLSCWLGSYIPEDLYTNGISQILNGSIAAVSLAAAWLMIRHTDGMKTRKMWVLVLFVYAVFSTMLLMRVTSFVDAPKQGLVCLRGWEMLVGNFLLWLLLLYPTETLRPGWLTFPKALMRVLPVIIAFVIEEITPIDLRALLALYPVVLLGFLIRHIRKYRQWCEENYSSMENIDAQWIVRYIILYLLDGAMFFALCFFASVPVAMTQQWLLLVIIGYSTEQILYRNDPWDTVRHKNAIHMQPQMEELEEENQNPDTESNAEYRRVLEEWMAGEKPYINPEFRLIDLRQVLPLNRTYLSNFINAEYNCNFYQFVTNYRIEEAKRLMKEQPDMKLQDVAEQSGFSSPVVFSRIFARETGMTPREWSSSN